MGSNWCFSFAPALVSYSAPRDLHRRAPYSICESSFLIHQDVYHDLLVFFLFFFFLFFCFFFLCVFFFYDSLTS